jgi:hypothetical protein
MYATATFAGHRGTRKLSHPWRTDMLYATAMNVAVAYNIYVRHRCDEPACPYHSTTCQWRPHILYATAMVVAVTYTFSIHLHYVAVAYRNFYTPRKTISPITIFLLVPQPTSPAAARLKEWHTMGGVARGEQLAARHGRARDSS